MNLTWPILIGTALADSINPVTFATMILLYQEIKLSKRKSQTSDILGAFIAGTFVTGILLGLTFLPVLQVSSSISPITYKIIGGFCVLMGLFTTKDFFMLQPNRQKPFGLWRLGKYKTKLSTHVAGAFALGSIITLVELPLTGTTYLATLSIAVMTRFPGDVAGVLTFYNAIYILPLILLGQYLQHNLDTKPFQLLHYPNKNNLILGTGMLLMSLGIWLIAG